jgi:hypothetical protein
MKKQMLFVLIGACLLVSMVMLGGCGGTDSALPQHDSTVQAAGVGNAMPSGVHYNLNIIGVKSPKEVGTSDGHTLFVNLDGTTKILMSQSQDGTFNVTDRNGTDGVAKFNIGDKNIGDARTHYRVYARALGKPGGVVKITPNATFDAVTGEVLFYLGDVTIARNAGKPKTENITNLYYADVTLTLADGTVKTYTNEWIFDIPELLEYWWDYNNANLKLLQVRFYEDVVQ